jgi:hypothetical protein
MLSILPHSLIAKRLEYGLAKHDGTLKEGMVARLNET